jgi:cytochrome c oxidase subunit 4
MEAPPKRDEELIMSGHVSAKSVYYTIFGALMVLTALTVFAAFVNLGAFNFPVALAIAIIKATLVVLFFMHVKYSSHLTKLVVLTGLFFLFILLAETFMDYATRGMMPTLPHLQ